MGAVLESLLNRYETGRMTRRELLGALAAFAASGPASAQGLQPAIGPVKQLNHVTLFVEDVRKSVGFYQDLFGMPVLTPQIPAST